MDSQTPDTLAYLLLGLAVIFGVMLVYVGSLVLRRRNLERDVQMIEWLDEDQQSP